MTVQQTPQNPGGAVPLRDLANAIRALSMDAVEAANSGHPGMPMGMADVATVLFTRFLKYDPAAPDWPDRDRFVLSAGHGSMLLYSLLYLTGYPEMTIEQIKHFRQLGSITAGHPEYGHAPGIETTTGPLGQGLATAVGMAIAERLQNARFGDKLVDHFTYVISGDGCLMEGVSHEAIDLAGHLKLSKLIVFWDDNSISIDGATSLSTSTDQAARFAAAGWDVHRIDGHDEEQIFSAIEAARRSGKPSLIACKTIIGKGAPNKQGTSATHGSPLGAEEIGKAREALGWPYPAFEVPGNILEAWRGAPAYGRSERQAWLQRIQEDPRGQDLAVALSGEIGEAMHGAVARVKEQFAKDMPKLATRQSSQAVLEALTAALPALIGGSADLTPSNGTKTKAAKPVKPGDFSGSYIHYGVREFGMAAAMNGIALHGGFIPFGGTFLTFSDYSRPAIRLGALMSIRVIHIMTHDSIGLGEDGPTHQPVEHFAALRAIPNLLVFRPADAMETAEAWAAALEAEHMPSVMCLSRQGLPALPARAEQAANLTAKGAYVVHEPGSARQVTILSTGSEVQLALAAAKALEADGIAAAVVSMPSWELFRKQPQEYRREVLGNAPRVAVEAGVRFGWDEWIGPDGAFIGMTGFGASAPAEALYRHFGITTEAIVAAARAALG
ncbi:MULTISPECIES: transketolase [Rhodomicrobium]|uniref:transketolase n=1 Tax=Rhodomicrobium TaxID=1068 RepID=UPI002477F381|nr:MULTISPECIES: transketolase [Rhodomicrobium]